MKTVKSMCEWCKELEIDPRYGFCTAYGKGPKRIKLNYVCSPLCGQSLLTHRVNNFNEYYYGLQGR